MKIYASNLDERVNDAGLRDLFAPYGKVRAAEVVSELFTSLSRGYGFVEMPDPAEAHRALAALDGRVFQGRVLCVRLAATLVSNSESSPIPAWPKNLHGE